MNSEHSITQYIDGLKAGDGDAAQRIWERFIERLISLANRKLKASPRAAMNEEDVVQKAFAEFFLQTQQGRFPRLNDRDDLWQVLAMLVDRRAKDQIRTLLTLKAGKGRVVTESIFDANDHSSAGIGLAGVEGMMPTPALAAELTELFRERLDMLENDEHRQVALLKMQGFNNQEIAKQLKSSLRTVERWLEKMRSSWSGKQDHE